MFNGIYWKIADFERENSLALKVRVKRMEYFKKLICKLPKPLKILDVGGTEVFWDIMGFAGNEDFKIVILNLSRAETHYSNFKSVEGDGRNMDEFEDNEFDVVFSNSVIEHVGSYEDQKKMASELKRVGKHVFLQTPSYYSPVEPHFFIPFFQMFPIWLRTFLLRHFNLGCYQKTENKKEAEKMVRSVHLMKAKEIGNIFQGFNIKREKLFGLTISFIVHDF